MEVARLALQGVMRRAAAEVHGARKTRVWKTRPVLMLQHFCIQKTKRPGRSLLLNAITTTQCEACRHRADWTDGSETYPKVKFDSTSIGGVNVPVCLKSSMFVQNTAFLYKQMLSRLKIQSLSYVFRGWLARFKPPLLKAGRLHRTGPTPRSKVAASRGRPAPGASRGSPSGGRAASASARGASEASASAAAALLGGAAPSLVVEVSLAICSGASARQSH